MSYTVSTRVDLPSFTLDMQRDHSDQRAHVQFVNYEKGDFVALTIGPATFYLSPAQVHNMIDRLTAAVENFRGAEDNVVAA